jgi:peptide/nickel transport system permease protein
MSELAVTDAIVGLSDTRAGTKRRRRVSFVIALCFLVMAVIVVMAILGSAIAPYDPHAQNPAKGLLTPRSEHLFGTDSLGQDVLSRVIVGARTALIGPFVIAGCSMLFGNLLGLWAGYRGGRVDSIIMRWVDLMWAVPSLLVIVVVAGAVGGSYWLAVALLIVLTIPFDTRVVRGATLEQAPRPYVEAAKAIGVSDRRIAVFHIWPNVAPVSVANAFLVFSSSLVALAGLSYLGLGPPAGTADWGLMLSEGQQYLFVNPVGTLAPGLLIVITATAMNLIGDWLYELMSRRGATR